MICKWLLRKEVAIFLGGENFICVSGSQKIHGVTSDQLASECSTWNDVESENSWTMGADCLVLTPAAGSERPNAAIRLGVSCFGSLDGLRTFRYYFFSLSILYR
jgi:hypothetical protein